MARPVFGEGALTLDPAKSVFINCPFDVDYGPLFDAIVFATVCCGFIPRSALDSGTVSVPRINRILGALKNCRYSIHDLSRCAGIGSEATARLNMPLELGMAMARRYIEPQGDHDWAALVSRDSFHIRFVSDLAAYDLLEHDGTPSGVVIALTPWLATRPQASNVIPRDILTLLPEFEARRKELTSQWSGVAPWADLVVMAIDVAKKLDREQLP